MAGSCTALLWLFPSTQSTLYTEWNSHPLQNVAWGYTIKDRIIMCMHWRAKLRSYMLFCNDFWLLLLIFAQHLSCSSFKDPIPPLSLQCSFLPNLAFSRIMFLPLFVPVSCPYFYIFCTRSLLLFLTAVWTNTSLPKAAVSWQIQLPPFHPILMSDPTFSLTLTQNTFRCTEFLI